MKNSVQYQILLFIALLAILTISFQFINLPLPWLSLVIMWTPAITAILTPLITDRKFGKYGWRFNLKWMGAGWLLPVIYGI